MHESDILCEISKGIFEILHKISYPQTLQNLPGLQL